MINHQTIRFCNSVAILIYLLPVVVFSAEYHVDRSAENSVFFVSESPLIDFEVVTDKIDGYVFWSGETFPPDNAQLKTGKIYFEVQLNTLDAGNGRYNRHLKEHYFETDKYPYASYTAIITEVELKTDSTFLVYTTGVFSLHGVSNEMEIVGSIISHDRVLSIKCEFAVKASEYDIELPSLMMMKVNDDINVSLMFNLRIAE